MMNINGWATFEEIMETVTERSLSLSLGKYWLRDKRSVGNLNGNETRSAKGDDQMEKDSRKI